MYVLNVLFATGSVALIYWFAFLVTKKSAVTLLATGLSACCGPLIFYTTWFYGEIPSLFALLLAACLFVKYGKTHKLPYLFFVAIVVSFAVMVRRTSFVFVIAVVLCGLVFSARKKDAKAVLLLILVGFLPILVCGGITKLYEIRSGYTLSGGYPTSKLLVIGLEESEGKYGRFFSGPDEVFEAVGYDVSAADLIYQEWIDRRLATFAENSSYALHFFHEKLLGQWNQPMCEAILLNLSNTVVTVQEGSWHGVFTSRLKEDYFWKVINFCDAVQFVVYMGMLLYFLFAVKKERNIIEQVLAVTILGGFLVTFLWEAAGRYAFAYYVMMFPLASIGYFGFLQWFWGTRMACLLKEKFEKKRKTVAE